MSSYSSNSFVKLDFEISRESVSRDNVSRRQIHSHLSDIRILVVEAFCEVFGMQELCNFPFDVMLCGIAVYSTNFNLHGLSER